MASCRTSAWWSGWLAPRGLAFNEDKTRIVTLDQGFDFKPLANSSGGVQRSESEGMIKLKLDNTARGAINGGGVEINVRSFNGSILVHKGK